MARHRPCGVGYSLDSVADVDCLVAPLHNVVEDFSTSSWRIALPATCLLGRDVALARHDLMSTATAHANTVVASTPHLLGSRFKFALQIGAGLADVPWRDVKKLPRDWFEPYQLL